MAIKLRIEEKDAPARHLELPEAEVIIGRGADNLVVIKDPRSSRKHCRLRETPQGFFLEDLGSANGTLLNGEAVKSAFLKPGDEFRIGATRFVFAPAAASALLEEEAVEPSPAAPPPTARREAASRRERSAEEAALEWVEGQQQGERLAISKNPFSIGRASGNDLCLRDTKVSGQHARIVKEGSNYVIEDLESRNGILVDGERVRRAVLYAGSKLVIGGQQFRAHVPAARPRGAAQAAVTGAEGPGEGLLSRIDAEAFEEGRAEQPLAVLALVAIIGLLAYFSIDLARRLLITAEVDPPAASNLLQNWSFEEKLPEAAAGAPAEVPGWVLEEGASGRLEITAEQAQYPGGRALKLTATGGEGLCRVLQRSAVPIGAERRFVIEGFVSSRGAFLAGYSVDWLRDGGGGQEIVGRGYSECARGPDGAVNVQQVLSAPANATHARAGCFLAGGSGSAIFDRISLTTVPAPSRRDEYAPALPPEDRGAGEEGNGDTGPVAFTLESDAGGLSIRLQPEGDFSLRRGHRLLLPSFWGGIPPARDPLGFGPRLAPLATQSGDRGAMVVIAEIPHLEAREWESVVTSVRADGGEIAMHWQLTAEREAEPERPPRLAVILESWDGSLEMVAHGVEASTQMRFAGAAARGCVELVLGGRSERTSLEFSTPVRISAQSHPLVKERAILVIEPEAPRVAELKIGFAPGSRREAQAARLLVSQAEKLFREGRAAEAINLLNRLGELYPEQRAERERAQQRLKDWREEAGAFIRDLERGYAELRQNPSPVVFDALLARATLWSQRFGGTLEGQRIDGKIGEIKAHWQSLQAQRVHDENGRILEQAREHFRRQELALAELHARLIIESKAEGTLARDAEQLLQRVAARRQALLENLLE
jgi:pSer/pThr/pTyr-binding forkhead associated (FHA) protein